VAGFSDRGAAAAKAGDVKERLGISEVWILDQSINSMTQFKQILGRCTRIREDYNKLYFTIMDFKNATRLFQDEEFDGEPVTVYEPRPDEPVIPRRALPVPRRQRQAGNR
jgi:hypothetical protein